MMRKSRRVFLRLQLFRTSARSGTKKKTANEKERNWISFGHKLYFCGSKKKKTARSDNINRPFGGSDGTRSTSAVTSGYWNPFGVFSSKDSRHDVASIDENYDVASAARGMRRRVEAVEALDSEKLPGAWFRVRYHVGHGVAAARQRGALRFISSISSRAATTLSKPRDDGYETTWGSHWKGSIEAPEGLANTVR